MADSFNEYQFSSVAALRALLRKYRMLEETGDAVSATILLDLRSALGDEAGAAQVLTKRQRQLIQLLYIDDLPAETVAQRFGISKRSVYLTSREGLERMIAFFHEQRTAKDWQQPRLIALLRDPKLSIDDIARITGRTKRAVENALSRHRSKYALPYRGAHGGRSTKAEPKRRRKRSLSRRAAAYL